jgi:hypothetical protein
MDAVRTLAAACTTQSYWLTGEDEMQSMRRRLRRGGMWLALVITGAMVSGPVAMRAAGHPDFTGKWQADLKTSDFGPMGAPDSAVMNVTQKDVDVTIHSELVMAGNSRAWDATCKIDGKECKSTTGEVTLSLQWQGDTLIVNRALSFNGMAIKIKETWSLSADGKTLTSARALETDQGNAEQKIIFTKS